MGEYRWLVYSGLALAELLSSHANKVDNGSWDSRKTGHHSDWRHVCFPSENMSSKKRRGEGKGNESWEKAEDILQGVILADSFDFKFLPITLEKPRVSESCTRINFVHALVNNGNYGLFWLENFWKGEGTQNWLWVGIMLSTLFLIGILRENI